MRIETAGEIMAIKEYAHIHSYVGISPGKGKDMNERTAPAQAQQTRERESAGALSPQGERALRPAEPKVVLPLPEPGGRIDLDEFLRRVEKESATEEEVAGRSATGGPGETAGSEVAAASGASVGERVSPRTQSADRHVQPGPDDPVDGGPGTGTAGEGVASDEQTCTTCGTSSRRGGPAGPSLIEAAAMRLTGRKRGRDGTRRKTGSRSPHYQPASISAAEPSPDSAQSPGQMGGRQEGQAEQVGSADASDRPLALRQPDAGKDAPQRWREEIGGRPFLVRGLNPDWRWQVVCRSLKVRALEPLWDLDAPARLALEILLDESSQPGAVAGGDPRSDMAVAIRLWRAGSDGPGPMVEALVCAGLSTEGIAHLVSLPPLVVECYEQVFFDLRGRLDRRAFMIDVLSGRLEWSIATGCRERWHLVWRWIGFEFGADALLAYVGMKPMPQVVRERIEELEDKLRERVSLEVVHVALTSTDQQQAVAATTEVFKRLQQRDRREASAERLALEQERLSTDLKKATIKSIARTPNRSGSILSVTGEVGGTEDRLAGLVEVIRLWLAEGNEGRRIDPTRLYEGLCRTAEKHGLDLPVRNAVGLGMQLGRHADRLGPVLCVKVSEGGSRRKFYEIRSRPPAEGQPHDRECPTAGPDSAPGRGSGG